MENCFNSIMLIITKSKSLYITWKIIREITLQRDYSLYSLEKVEFTEFLSKNVMMRAHHGMEKREILSHWKKFRQINHLVISLVKPLLSRNFCEKVWERISRSSTVEITEIYSHWKNVLSNHLFSNFFSKSVTFTKFLPKMRESEFS